MSDIQTKFDAVAHKLFFFTFNKAHFGDGVAALFNYPKRQIIINNLHFADGLLTAQKQKKSKNLDRLPEVKLCFSSGNTIFGAREVFLL